MRNRIPTLVPEQHRWIRQWHAAMRRRREQPRELPALLRGMGLADRARLRRATTELDLASDEATMLLAHGLVGNGDRWALPDSHDTYRRVGIIAGVLAHVDDDEHRTADAEGSGRGVTLAARLGRKSGGNAVLSELRFRQLRGATHPEDLLRLWRRAVKLAKGRADVATLADDIYTWQWELESKHVSPSKSARFHWAYDYYQQPRSKATDDVSPPTTETTV